MCRRRRFARCARSVGVGSSWCGCGRGWCRCCGRCCCAAARPTRRSGKLYSARGLAWLAQVALPPEAAASCQRLNQPLRLVHTEVTAADGPGGGAGRGRSDCRGARRPGRDLGPVLRADAARGDRKYRPAFRGGPQLASYAGIVPRVSRSAGRGYSGRITRDGAPWVRWALVEAARHAVKRQDAVGRWARQLGRRIGWQKARVALCAPLV